MMPMAAGETFPLLFYSSAKNKMEWKLTSKPFKSLSQDIFLTDIKKYFSWLYGVSNVIVTVHPFISIPLF